jgi:hypothetical protein
MNDYYWSKITFGLNLQTATLDQLSFLKQIDQIGHLYEGYYFERALYRYEQIWLPLLAANEYLIAPIDVEWIWHVHLLSPLNYLNDCQKIYGKVLNHSIRNEQEAEKAALISKEIWESFSNVSYNYLEDFKHPRNFETNINYDLRSASLRQKGFVYQVSLPHFENKIFLNKGVDRYKKFLFMKNMFRDELIVPCFLIDLIWHTHQLHPVDYYYDTKEIFGDVLVHDGCDSYHASLFTTDDRTREIWRQVKYGPWVTVKVNVC